MIIVAYRGRSVSALNTPPLASPSARACSPSTANSHVDQKSLLFALGTQYTITDMQIINVKKCQQFTDLFISVSEFEEKKNLFVCIHNYRDISGVATLTTIKWASHFLTQERAEKY